MDTEKTSDAMKSPYHSSSKESTRNPEAGLLNNSQRLGDGDFADMQRLGKKQEFKARRNPPLEFN